jgi:hypothetical protein
MLVILSSPVCWQSHWPASASAAENNPLHPSYFWDKTQVTLTPNSAGNDVVAPITNPLHPGYFAAKASVAPFTETAVWSSHRDVNDRNPLHPSYHRS